MIDLEKRYHTNYRKAIHWCGNHYILCNYIAEIDPQFFYNLNFSCFYYEDENGNTYENEDEIPEGVNYDEHYREIFQYFLSDCSQYDVEYLEKHFPGLLFGYSPLLDLWVLCVDHFGTMWTGVDWETDLKNAEC